MQSVHYKLPFPKTIIYPCTSVNAEIHIPMHFFLKRDWKLGKELIFFVPF